MAAAMEVSDEPYHGDEDLTPQAIIVDRSTGRTVVAVPGETLAANDIVGWGPPRRCVAANAAAKQLGSTTKQASLTGESAAKASPSYNPHYVKKVNAAMTKSARMPAGIPRDEHKIIIRPRGGLHAGRVRATELMAAMRTATGIARDEALRDTICPNTQQNIIVVSTPCEARAAKYAQLQSLRVSEQEYEVCAYQAAPDGTAKGVIHGIDREDTAEEIRENIVNEYNPLALDAHRIGNSTAVIVLFQGLKVPSTVKYGAVLLRCNLYRQHREVCTTCGKIGHRRDVCPQPHVRVCLACGKRDPGEEHELECKPHCKLCGGPHTTGTQGCTNKFKIPYIVKRRQWERKESRASERKDDRNFPPLGIATEKRGRSSSREEGRSRERRSRNRASGDISCSADRGAKGRSRSRSASRSRGRVEWADVVKATAEQSRAEHERARGGPQMNRRTTPEERINAENTSLRKENAQLRLQLADINEKLQRLLAAREKQQPQQQPQQQSQQQPQRKAPAQSGWELGRAPLPQSLSPRSQPQPTTPTKPTPPTTPANPQPKKKARSPTPSPPPGVTEEDHEADMEAQEEDETVPQTAEDEQEMRTQGGMRAADRIRLRRCVDRIDKLEKRVDRLSARLDARIDELERSVSTRLDALQEFLYRKLGRDEDVVATGDRNHTDNSRTSTP